MRCNYVAGRYPLMPFSPFPTLFFIPLLGMNGHKGGNVCCVRAREREVDAACACGVDVRISSCV